MAYLVKLDPNKELGYTVDGADKPATEKDLFEALWICVKTVAVSGAELEPAISIRSTLKSNSEEGGSIKMAQCGACGQRVAKHASVRTLNKAVALIIDSDEFQFMKSCPERWQAVPGELQEHFVELKKRFKNAEEKTPEQWKKVISTEE